MFKSIRFFALVFSFGVLLTACKKEVLPQQPTVTTNLSQAARTNCFR
jgi:hypothetical protein